MHGDVRPNEFDRVYDVVRAVPQGRVVTYGQVAQLAGMPRSARRAGYALHALRDGNDVPWWRVINAAGRISLRDPARALLQQRLLENEGVRFGISGAVDLRRWQWRPE